MARVATGSSRPEAGKAGFKVQRDAASHFKMLNQPDEVAEQMTRYFKIAK